MAVDVAAMLRDDRLDEAIAALNLEVRAKPMDTNLRAALCELLCISGNLERADVILDALSNLDPSLAVGTSLFRHLLRAEQARKQFYSDGRLPEFVVKPDAVTELELRAAVLLREGQGGAAMELIEERDAQRHPVAGAADGNSFDDFRDLDDATASHLEVLTPNGKYYWVPFTEIISIDFRKPERRRDLLWRRARLTMVHTPDGEVYLPSIYCVEGSTPRQLLGAETDFEGGEESPVVGRGLRTFLVGDDGRTILELSSVQFAHG